MAYWDFSDYITEGHTCPILDWWAAQDEEVQAAFEILIKALSETEDWEALEPSRRKHKVLTGKHAGMCELMFTVNGKGKFRPLGLWRPEQRDFILLGGCKKRRSSTIPPGAFDHAFDLMLKFNDGRGGIRSHV